MKATDLQIGDWVVYNGDVEYSNPIKIEGMDIATGMCITSDRDDAGFDGVDPIPLTVEILKKNGFKKQYGNDWCYYKYKDDDTSKESLYYILYDIDSLYLEIAAFTNASGEYNRMGVCYVHELQHILKLCGIDKEIEL